MRDLKHLPVRVARDFLSDLRSLFSDWGRYYRLPVRWSSREWVLFVGLLGVLVVAGSLDETMRYLSFTFHGRVADSVFGFGRWYGRGFATLYLFLGFYAVGSVMQWPPVRTWGILIVKAYLYSGLVTISLKSLVGRWRPYVGHGNLTFTPFIAGPNEYLSFPSGHTCVAFALSTVMAGISRNKAWKVFWFVMAAVTGLSRIYHDDHWLSDVVFSVINGFVAGAWLLKRYREDIRFGNS